MWMENLVGSNLRLAHTNAAGITIWKETAPAVNRY